MRKQVLAVLVALIFVPVLALADGGIIPDYYIHVFEPEQKAIITWEGTIETMLLSTRFTADGLGNMAWIVPIQSSTKPVVTASDMTVFRDFVNYFTPPRTYNPGFGVVGSADFAKGVQVIETVKVDIYDITILKTTDASALVDWLNSNGYRVPVDAVPVIARYVGENRYFLANKVNLKNRHAAAIDKMVTFNSSFESMTLAEQERLTEIRYYRYGTTDDVLESDIRELWHAFGDLQRGISTPLKITFTPSKPTFPLAISSINSGSTRIDVYVAAPTAMKDGNGVLEVDKALSITDAFRSGAAEFIDLGDANVITRLTYVGDLSGLGNDAEFVPSTDTSVEDVNIRAFIANVESVPVLILNVLVMIVALPLILLSSVF